MKSKIYLLLLTRQVKCGFTLLELLAASMMTIFVVLAAGYGTMVVMRENTASSVASDTQYNLNRAADYIADDIKSSSSALTNLSSLPSGGCNDTGSGYTPILALDSGAIVYCLKTTNGTEPWLGKNVIYRSVNSGTPQALVDLIAEAPQNSNCQNPSLTNKIPSTPKGFFVCLDDSGKNIEIHLSTSAVDINSGKAQTTSWMKSSTDTNNTGRFADKATYEVVSQAYARSKGTIPITVSGGTATFNQKAEAKFSTAGCNSLFDINVAGTTTKITANGETTIIISPSSLALTSAGGTFTVAATANNNVVTFTSGTCVVTTTLNTP